MMNAPDTAAAIAKILTSAGYTAKVWAKAEHPRVYVSRRLSKRMQDMGYIEVQGTDINVAPLTRNQAGLRDLVIRGLAAL